jgi:hypothetical protein
MVKTRGAWNTAKKDNNTAREREEREEDYNRYT